MGKALGGILIFVGLLIFLSCLNEVKSASDNSNILCVDLVWGGKTIVRHSEINCEAAKNNLTFITLFCLLGFFMVIVGIIEASKNPKPEEAKSNNNCSSCGSLVPPGDIFCSTCGTKVSMECPNCHLSIQLGIQYCGKCGMDVISSYPNRNEKPRATATCPNCNSIVNLDGRFCGKCRTELWRPCSNCGLPIMYYDKVCKDCRSSKEQLISESNPSYSKTPDKPEQDNKHSNKRKSLFWSLIILIFIVGAYVLLGGMKSNNATMKTPEYFLPTLEKILIKYQPDFEGSFVKRGLSINCSDPANGFTNAGDCEEWMYPSDKFKNSVPEFNAFVYYFKSGRPDFDKWLQGNQRVITKQLPKGSVKITVGEADWGQTKVYAKFFHFICGDNYWIDLRFDTALKPTEDEPFLKMINEIQEIC